MRNSDSINEAVEPVFNQRHTKLRCDRNNLQIYRYLAFRSRSLCRGQSSFLSSPSSVRQRRPSIIRMCSALPALLTFVVIFSREALDAAPSDRFDLDDQDSFYDQRQNGTENLRVDVKDVFLVWAPEGPADVVDYPDEEIPQHPSNDIERPTSIIDILNSFQQLSAAASQPPEEGN